MPRGVQGTGLQTADGKRLLIIEQHIELAAIAGKPLVGIEQRTKDLLHLGNLTANSNLATQGLFEIRRRR
ncbi:hypothetical protein D3C72_2024000 [compost metagenome]